MRKTAAKIKTLISQSSLVTDEAYHLATLRHAPDMAEIIWEVKRAFARGIEPLPTEHGTSSSYFLRDTEGRPIAIFKWQNYLREMAAYRLDYENFAGVPPTVITTLEHPFWGRRTGVCQWYVPGSITAVKLDRHHFKKLSAASVRRIAAFDIRTINVDRHTSNLLVVDELFPIPIDHGYILTREATLLHFAWMNWEQSSTPFTDYELSYIFLLDPERDRRILIDELHIEEKRANHFFIASILLKMGALKGFSPSEIGKFMAKEYHHDVSLFDAIVDHIKKKNPPNWPLFSRSVYDEIEKTLDRAYEKTTR